MGPMVMALLLLGGWGLFAWSAFRRWNLMMVGAGENRFDQPAERIRRTLRYAIAQVRMRRYPLAGLAHLIIFFGFGVLLLRTLILWGRGFDPTFDFWIFGTDQPLGKVYSFLKDLFAVLVILGALVFVYYRVIARLPRMTLSVEGLLILGIILTMMLADILYDGASMARAARIPGESVTLKEGYGHLDPETQQAMALQDRRWGVAEDDTVPTPRPYRRLTPGEQEVLPVPRIGFHAFEPAGSVAAMALRGLSDDALVLLGHAGFWTHSVLVLLFLNLLPYSKHFHVITAIPNVYTQSLKPPGRLPPIEDIDGKLEREETLGIRRIEQFSWKAILDFYTCTECGRCSDHCPAAKTGKKLSPKHFTLDLRDFLYAQERPLVTAKAGAMGQVAGNGKTGDSSGTDSTRDAESGAATATLDGEHRKDLVDGVIDPEVLWACTTCRACEQECPVFISYVDKIVDMRRYLVQERGEFPTQLQSAFKGLETNANPWSFPAEDRAKWADGLNIPTLAEKPDAPVLFWVGCAPAFDERAKKVTRATARLMQKAGVDFAILGPEEQCTGDPARRAGNEYLFQIFAKANVEVLNGFGVDRKTVVTVCPHCFNTLKNEYPDFGGNYDVVHHTTFLAGLVRQGKLRPTKHVDRAVAFHDSCYLGRYNDVYDDPRSVLASIPGVRLVEPIQTRDRGMCCGAGGAQMFKEEEHGRERVNVARTQQLLDAKPDAISSACPFCMRMLIDGLAEKEKEAMPQLDVAEMLLEAVEIEEPTPARA